MRNEFTSRMKNMVVAISSNHWRTGEHGGFIYLFVHYRKKDI